MSDINNKNKIGKVELMLLVAAITVAIGSVVIGFVTGGWIVSLFTFNIAVLLFVVATQLPSRSHQVKGTQSQGS